MELVQHPFMAMPWKCISLRELIRSEVRHRTSNPTRTKLPLPLGGPAHK